MLLLVLLDYCSVILRGRTRPFFRNIFYSYNLMFICPTPMGLGHNHLRRSGVWCMEGCFRPSRIHVRNNVVLIDRGWWLCLLEHLHFSRFSCQVLISTLLSCHGGLSLIIVVFNSLLRIDCINSLRGPATILLPMTCLILYIRVL
jgi:hypothetical protein